MATTNAQQRKLHGITEKTPKHMLFGAGTIHKGLTWNATKGWNFDETIIGATSGGSELEITGEYIDIEVDGAFVKVKGLTVKQGGAATLKTSFAEVSPATLAMAAQAKVNATSTVKGFDEIELKGKIEEGDYLENFAYVGNTLNNSPVIVIFEQALCTSGLKLSGKQKENGVLEVEIQAYANIGSDLSTVPVKIYYPKTGA